MNKAQQKYCLNCASPLILRKVNQQKRLACSNNQCDFVLNDELDSIKIFTREELKKWPFGQEKLDGWPFGCGWAIRDWLNKKKSSVLANHE